SGISTSRGCPCLHQEPGSGHCDYAQERDKVRDRLNNLAMLYRSRGQPGPGVSYNSECGILDAGFSSKYGFRQARHSYDVAAPMPEETHFRRRFKPGPIAAYVNSAIYD